MERTSTERESASDAQPDSESDSSAESDSGAVPGERPRAPRGLSADLRMRQHAARFVRDVTARGRLPLDYSVASLRVVDFIVDGLRRSGRDHTAVGHVLFGLGAYAGEVLVRRAGAAWVEFDQGQRELFGQPVGVRMPDGRVWNPLGKVAKRFQEGERESLRTLYLQLHGRERTGLHGCAGAGGPSDGL